MSGDNGDKKHYSFGHKKEAATLDIEEERLVVKIRHEYGNEYLTYLVNYKDKVSLLAANDKMATLEIRDTSIADEVIHDLFEVAKIKCKVTIKDANSIDTLHIKFSEMPYKRVVNYLKDSGFEHNKKLTKFWKSDVSDKDRCKTLSRLNSFKYLRVYVEFK